MTYPGNLFCLGYGVGRVAFTPLSLSPAAWYRADAGVRTNAARQFDSASSRYLSRASEAALQTGDVDFTIVGWIKPVSATGYPQLFSKSQECESFIEQSNDKVSLRVRDAATGLVSFTANGPVFTMGSWSMAECYHDASGNLLGIGLNGAAPLTTSYADGVRSSTGHFKIGAGDDGAPMDGPMGRFGFWKRLLTTAERTWLYNSGAGRFYAELGVAGTDGADLLTGLVEYWDMAEKSGAAIGRHAGLDLTSNNNVGVAVGPGEGAAYDGTPRCAIQDQSGNGVHRTQTDIAKMSTHLVGIQNGLPVGRYDGTNDYESNITIATDGAGLTWFGVVKYTALGAYQNLWEKVGATHPQLWIDNSDKLELNGAGTVSRAPSAISGYHAVIVRVGATTQSIYVDGVEVDSDATTTTIPASLTVTCKNRGGSSTFAGDECEEGFIGRDLAVAEITALFAYLKSRWATP